MSRRPAETVATKQIERGLSPVIVQELKKEYKEKEKNEQNVTYIRDNQNNQKRSVVNPMQLQYQNNTQEDQQFLARLDNLISEYGVLKSQTENATKLKSKTKQMLLERNHEFGNNLKQLSTIYRGKVPIMKLHKDYQMKLEKYKKDLEQINFKLTLLAKSNIFKKSRINRELKQAAELLIGHDNIIQTWLKLEPRDIILNAGEVIIEKIVEAEPNEEKIRALISKNIQDFIPEPKSPEPIIKTQTQVKTVYVPAEPDHLGKAYHLLYGQKNYAEALAILKQLDAKNDAEAQCMIGVIYLEGIGARKDINKAKEYLYKASNSGNPEAMYRLACLLEKGVIQESNDRSENIEKAVEYYEKAAMEGNLNALTDLAFLLENGKYVNRDVNEAYKLLKVAADKYFPRALNNLGIMLFKNLIKEGDSNDKKAFEYFQMAADQGFPKAFTNIGICYEKGRGVEKNLNKAIEYYKLGAELLDVDGIFHIAYYTMQEAGKDDDQKKYVQTADLFRDVVSRDPEYADAHYYLGFLFENGLGVEQDLKTAFNYYEKAAYLNHSKGWVKIGSFHMDGLGVPKDPETAKEAYEKAADLNDTEALNLLGVLHEEGIDGYSDYKKAYEYYIRASNLGNAKAKLNLGFMYEKGRYVQQDMNEAMKYYEEAADLGNVQAQIIISNNMQPLQRLSADEARRDELETSLAQDLDNDALEINNIALQVKNTKGSLSRQLERLGIPTTSTIPTNQYVKDVGSNAQLKQGTYIPSLLSEDLVEESPEKEEQFFTRQNLYIK